MRSRQDAEGRMDLGDFAAAATDDDDGDVAAARPGSARHVTPAAGSAAASRLSRGCLAAGRRAQPRAGAAASPRGRGGQQRQLQSLLAVACGPDPMKLLQG